MLARPPALLLDERLSPPPSTTDLDWGPRVFAGRGTPGPRVFAGRGTPDLPRRSGGALASARQCLPYVVTTHYIAQRDALFVRDGLTPEGAFGLPRVGGDLFLALARDLGDGLSILFPSDIAREDLDWSRCIDEAQENLRAKVGTRELPLAVYEVPRALTADVAPWRPGTQRVDATERILVIGPSWLAASCLAHPALPAGAASRLGASRLMAILPHRDRLFVFPDRGPAANEAMAGAIRAIESDNAGRLPSVLYRLDAYGPTAL